MNITADSGTYCPYESIETVVQNYSDMIYRIALFRTGNKSDAEDALQNVFLTYYKKNKTFYDEEHRKAWLIRTAVNCANKIAGSTWRKRTVSLDEIPDSEILFESKDENEIYSALMQLPHKYRTVIQLFYFQDMSVSQISAALKIKEGTVKVQLNRGRELMKKMVKGECFDE